MGGRHPWLQRRSCYLPRLRIQGKAQSVPPSSNVHVTCCAYQQEGPRVFDAGNDPDGAATGVTGLDLDVEHPRH